MKSMTEPIEEEPEPMTIVPKSSSVASGTVYTTGGILSTSTSPSTWAPRSPAKPRLVKLPPKVTETILLAFLEKDTDGEDDAVWAAKLRPMNVNIDFDSGGEARMIIEFSLIDIESP